MRTIRVHLGPEYTVVLTSWSDDGSSSVTEMAINNGNTVKKFDATVFAGFDVPGDVT